MFKIEYNTDYPYNTAISIEIDNDDIDISNLFAAFIDMTLKIGYCPASWVKTIKEAAEWCDNSDGVIDYIVEHN